MFNSNKPIHLAYFITPHGFGHAARACAVMEAIHNAQPDISFEIFTTVPEWFFRESLSCAFEFHSFVSDVGLIQLNSMQEDIPQTIQRLRHYYPFSDEVIRQPCQIILKKDVRLILCDISPIAISIAERCNVPSVLIENFTWDWIYEGYSHHFDLLDEYISNFRKVFQKAHFHIQTNPVCNVNPDADMRCAPVSRTPRSDKRRIREQLGLNSVEKVILITMGGIPGSYSFIRELERFSQFCFVIPGAAEQTIRHENVILLPHHSNFFHPDLVHASDMIVGKVGYSTLAETYHAGIPLGYLARKAFRESAFLIDFVEQEMVGMEISEEEFQSVQWIEKISHLVNQPKIQRTCQNGADQIAQFLRKQSLIN